MNDENNTIMCSLDSSSNKTGFAVWENGNLYKYHLLDYSQYKDTEIRLEKMIKGICKLLSHYKPSIVVIENMNNPRNVAAFRLLCKLLGVVQCWCVFNKCEYHEINPSQWRKYAKKKAEKTGVKREELKAWSIKRCMELFGIMVNDDVSDAILVGYGYMKMLNG